MCCVCVLFFLFHNINYRNGNNIQAVHKYIKNKALNGFKCFFLLFLLLFVITVLRLNEFQIEKLKIVGYRSNASWKFHGH